MCDASQRISTDRLRFSQEDFPPLGALLELPVGNTPWIVALSLEQVLVRNSERLRLDALVSGHVPASIRPLDGFSCIPKQKQGARSPARISVEHEVPLIGRRLVPAFYLTYKLCFHANGIQSAQDGTVSEQ